MRKAIDGLTRFIVTPMVSSTRIFCFLDGGYLPNQKLVVFPRDDEVFLGILSSSFHELWTLRYCSWIGAGNDPTYATTSVYSNFPFPEGLTPDVPANAYADDPRAQAIAAAAARLNELRENWLNPADFVVRQPEVVPGYPDLILPRDEDAGQELKRRTLTNLYNARPQWLANAHAALDEPSRMLTVGATTGAREPLLTTKSLHAYFGSTRDGPPSQMPSDAFPLGQLAAVGASLLSEAVTFYCG